MVEHPQVLNNEKKHWFVLNFVRQQGCASPTDAIAAFGRPLELFAPTIKATVKVGEKIIFREKPLTFHYLFVRGTLDDVKALCSSSANGFSFVLNPGSQSRYAIVTDDDMESFKEIARRFDNTLPFYNIEAIDLQEGDLVEVIDGPFAGLKGRYLPKSRSNKGNLVIAATDQLGTIIWNVEARYVRILRFAPGNNRQYDLIDKFITRLLPILRHFHSRLPLTQREKSALAVFCLRMEVVEPENPKIRAKLLAALRCAQTILGHSAAATRSAARLAQCIDSVTNPWTRALINLLDAALAPNLAPMRQIRASLPQPQTASQRLLALEVNHYLTPLNQ